MGIKLDGSGKRLLNVCFALSEKALLYNSVTYDFLDGKKSNNWNRGPDEQYSGLIYRNNIWLLSAITQCSQYDNLQPQDEE